MKKTIKKSGPLSAYAESYLGLEDAQLYDETIFEIEKVWVSSYVQPDPEQMFYVSVDKRSKEDKSLLLSLSKSGLILGVNKQVIQPQSYRDNVNVAMKHQATEDAFSYYADNNFYQKIDTVVRKISIDTVNIQQYQYNTTWLVKDPEQKAKEAVANLEKIREQRFLLLTGYQEVDYGESMAYMDGQLKKMEAELISLFTGIVTTETVHKSFYFTPSVSTRNRNAAVFKFSQSEGAFDLTDSRGEDVYIQFDVQNATANVDRFLISPPSEQEKPIDGFYYRIPEFADVEIRFGDERLFKSNFVINQFGKVVQSPSLKSEIEFDPKTGQIKNIHWR